MAPVPELENESLEEGKHSERERIEKEGQDNEGPVKEGLGKEAREMKPVLKESPTQTNLDQDEPLETANAFPCGTARSRPFMDGVDWIQQLSSELSHPPVEADIQSSATSPDSTLLATRNVWNVVPRRSFTVWSRLKMNSLRPASLM
jgi:hypothetical protein